jgi:hypothetical protein
MTLPGLEIRPLGRPAPDGCFIPRQPGRLIVGRNVRLDSTQDPRVEAGSNTSIVTLRVVGGDKKGSLESETVKYGLESHGSRTRG